MKTRSDELLVMLAEECGEVTQRVTKILRFGMDNVYPKDVSACSNKFKLEQEIGDFIAVLDAMSKEGIISMNNITEQAENKMARLDIFMTHKAQKPSIRKTQKPRKRD